MNTARDLDQGECDRLVPHVDAEGRNMLSAGMDDIRQVARIHSATKGAPVFLLTAKVQTARATHAAVLGWEDDTVAA